MSRQYWVAPIGPLTTADGTALASSTTLTDISPAPQITLPANILEVGSEIEINAQGQFSNTSAPTLILGFYYGGVAGTAIAASAAITTASTVTSVEFLMRYRGIIRSIGSSGQIKGEGAVYLGNGTVAASVLTVYPLPTGTTRTATLDTTAAKVITVGAQWSASSASNTITCYDISVRLVT